MSLGAGPALAQDRCPEFGAEDQRPGLLNPKLAPITYLKDHAWTERFDRMFGKTSPPEWLKGATESEAVSVTMDGKPYEVLLACKKHDCGNHQLVVLFDRMATYGLLFQTTDNSSNETLT